MGKITQLQEIPVWETVDVRSLRLALLVVYTLEWFLTAEGTWL